MIVLVIPVIGLVVFYSLTYAKYAKGKGNLLGAIGTLIMVLMSLLLPIYSIFFR